MPLTNHAAAPADPTDAADLVRRLPLAERIRLLSGADMWSTATADGIDAVVFANGPNGVGKQETEGDHVGATATLPATCFPSAAALASSWDESLLTEVGAAMGREARAQGVDVLLGPGMNLKRHPGGGRVFEYFSEDPLVTGKMAAALVRGVQSQGVGSSIKHFAGNNQETDRMRMDSVVDERTLRELYLRGFEIAVREGEPWTVMTSYNLLNGEHTGESAWLLTQVLRSEWGFDGAVLTDWIAAYDRVAGVRAGLDLDMPGGTGAWEPAIRRSLRDGSLTEQEIDRAAANVVRLSLRARAGRQSGAEPVALDAHHALARRAAAAGTVLLRNGDGMLPLASPDRLAVIGAGARTPRFQGIGSAAVHAWRVDAALDSFRERLGDRVDYVPGYDLKTGEVSDADVAAARASAGAAEAVVLILAVPAGAEAEGVDRSSLEMPAGFARLVDAVIDANPRTAVVLVNGAPLELPWADRPAALVEAYLGGQAAGSALVDVLFGDAEPGGRLAESFPLSAADLPASANFPTTRTQAQYRETLHVGYRFHDTFDAAPRFPFGHGLSYTTFEYRDLVVTVVGEEVVVDFEVANVGTRRGSDVPQLYVAARTGGVARPAQELRAFRKLELEPGETRSVSMPLAREAFAHWDRTGQRWAVEAGAYQIRIGASSRDIRLSTSVTIASSDEIAAAPGTTGAVATDAEFAALLGHAVPTARGLLPYTADSTIDDLRSTWLGRRLRSALLAMVSKQIPDGGDDMQSMLDAVVGGMPLRAMVASAGGRLSFEVLDTAIAVLNAASPAARRALRSR